MEPVEAEINRKRYRMIHNLGKYRVMERHDQIMKLALGGSTTMTVVLPARADVKAGDILTLYTEIFYADPSQSPVQ